MSLLYSKAADILKQVCEGGKGFRDVFYSSSSTEQARGKLYALITKTLALRSKLEDALKTVLPEETFANHYFTLAMLCDVVHGREISGGGKVKRLLETNKAKFKLLLKPDVKKKTEGSVVGPKRFIRVTCDIKKIEAIIREGLLKPKATKASKDSQDSAEPTEDNTAPVTVTTPIITEPFFKPTEFPEVFEFVDQSLVGQILKDESLRKSIFSSLAYLQDKSTCMTANVLLHNRLAKMKNIHVMDVCAAPGSKSLHILSKLQEGDSLTLVEKSKKRAEVLKKRIMEASDWTGNQEDIIQGQIGKGVKVRIINADFLTVNIPSVTHISVDPSCSGSGLDLHNQEDTSTERVSALTEMQRKLLRHALDPKAFPNAQTVLYSTCSQNTEENEDVAATIASQQAAKRYYSLSDLTETPKFLVPFKDNQKATNGVTVNSLKTTQTKNQCRGFFLTKFNRVPEKKTVTLAKTKKVKKAIQKDDE